MELLCLTFVGFSFDRLRLTLPVFQLMSASCRRSILPTPLWYATLFFFLSRGEFCKARKE
ncbi:hypothetical protein BBKW_1778 [Bifidobacterium catenulatum subsp. kashiwanohense JCM 15439 = DSM 21854]|nr:hypothetical protein BBKW_1778 [Bifidobacterium catenulatum subsp. kashiwanohense JCM 15439 = DSM 21854]